MLRVLLCSSLVALALASDYSAPQPACQPKQETILITRTNLINNEDQVTQHNIQHNYSTVDVTSLILISSTATETISITEYPSPVVTTITSSVTATAYSPEYETALATAVTTHITQLLASSVDVQELTITQTAIVPQPITQILTITNVKTAFETLTRTDTISTFVTKTVYENFFVTETSYQTFFKFATKTVTSSSDNIIEATVTVTDRQYVTKCFQPKVTYDH